MEPLADPQKRKRRDGTPTTGSKIRFFNPSAESGLLGQGRTRGLNKIRITRVSTALERPGVSSVAFELYKRPYGTYHRDGWIGRPLG